LIRQNFIQPQTYLQSNDLYLTDVELIENNIKILWFISGDLKILGNVTMSILKRPDKQRLGVFMLLNLHFSLYVPDESVPIFWTHAKPDIVYLLHLRVLRFLKSGFP